MMRKFLFGLLCASISLYINAQNKVMKVMVPGSKGTLAAEIQTPENKANKKFPVVILAHGFGGDRSWELFKMVSDSLQKEGIASILF